MDAFDSDWSGWPGLAWIQPLDLNSGLIGLFEKRRWYNWLRSSGSQCVISNAAGEYRDGGWPDPRPPRPEKVFEQSGGPPDLPSASVQSLIQAGSSEDTSGRRQQLTRFELLKLPANQGQSLLL